VSEIVSLYDMTLMDEQSRRLDQSATKVAGGSSNSKGATIATTTDLMGSKIDLGGDTFLPKTAC